MDYPRLLKEAQEEHAGMVTERDSCLEKVRQLERDILVTDRLIELYKMALGQTGPQTGEDLFASLDPDALGVTDAIRKVIATSNVPLEPTQIRDALRTAGYEKSSSKNLLITVHNTLDRLKGKDFEEVKIAGKTAYRSKPRKIVSSAPAPIAPLR
jgi:hypothetical protein